MAREGLQLHAHIMASRFRRVLLRQALRFHPLLPSHRWLHRFAFLLRAAAVLLLLLRLDHLLANTKDRFDRKQRAAYAITL